MTYWRNFKFFLLKLDKIKPINGLYGLILGGHIAELILCTILFAVLQAYFAGYLFEFVFEVGV